MSTKTTYSSSFEIQDGAVMPVQFFKENYLYGLPLFDKAGYGDINRLIDDKMLWAQQELENHLCIKFKKQIIAETTNFIRNEWAMWGFVKTTYPVTTAFQLDGYLNSIQQVHYPLEWLTIRKSNSGSSSFFRNIHLVPNNGTGTNQNSAAQNQAIFSGITPQLGFLGAAYIPNYWQIVYCTGFDEVPRDLLDYIGKYASCQILALISDITFGAGIASLSLGFDGFSQSIGTTQSPENMLYSARIKQYQNELKDSLNRLEMKYRGITFDVI